MLTRNAPKLPLLLQDPNYRKKRFRTHVTIGSFSMLVQKDVENISKDFCHVHSKILLFEVTNNLSQTPQKFGILHFRSQLLNDRMSKMFVTFWIHSSSFDCSMVVIFQIIQNYIACKKKIVH